MQIAHKIEMKANNKEKTYFKKASGVSRFCWNWGLGEWNRKYEDKEKQGKAMVKITGLSLKKEFNAIKKKEFSWTEEVTKYAAQQPFIQLDVAWKRFFNKKLRARKPQFKKKNKTRDSFYIGGDHLRIKEKKIKIPKLGYVRLRERLRFKGKINGATITRTADRWYISIQVEVDEKDFKKCKTKKRIGIDLGINKAVTMSNGIGVEATKPLRNNLRKLKREQRKVSKKIRIAKEAKRKLRDSKNLEKAKNKVARLHKRISNIRKDSTQKLTTYITRNYLYIAIEDLHVKGMIKNHNLARAIADIGLGEIRRELEYKSKMRGNKIYKADRYYPSSKRCNVCKEIKKELSLKERIFKCECGHKMDRDLNAAKNLEELIEVRPVRPELTPEEITAMREAVYPLQVTSISETGSKLQTG